MRRVVGQLYVLFAAGCMPEPAGVTWLGFPEDADAQSLVIATRGADLRLTAIDLSSGADRSKAEIHLGDEAPYRTVHALLYDARLSRLGMVPGDIARGTSAADGELLPPPDRGVYVTEVDESSRAVTWRREGALPDDLRSFRVRAPVECAVFGPAAQRHVVDGKVAYVVRLDDEHALVRTETEAFVFSEDGLRELDSGLLLDTWSAFLAEENLYVGDASGRVWRGRPSIEHGIVDAELYTTTPLSAILSIDGGEGSDDELELLLVDQLGQIGRLNGTTFTALSPVTGFRTPVVWLEPGRGLMAAAGIDLVFTIEGDVVDTAQIGADSQIMSLARHSELGAVAGTAEGHFYAYRGLDDEWGRVVGADFGWWSLASAPYEDGFLFALASGFTGQYKRSRGFCESSPLLPIIEAAKLLVLGHDLVITAVPDDSPSTTLLYVPRIALD